MATIDYRSNAAALMRQILADELAHHNYTYAPIRPESMPPRPYVNGMKVRADCSKFAQYVMWWIYSPVDPMEGGWGPWGNSSTLWLHCQHLDSPSGLLIGDFVTFGVAGSEHATIVLEAGTDPLLCSFGHQGAPNTYRLSQDSRPSQYLRNPLPGYVPTPNARLRTLTGWFAWMAWYEGEGDWKGKGPHNAGVRPNVPRLIPLVWWKRRISFLLNRNKGNKATK